MKAAMVAAVFFAGVATASAGPVQWAPEAGGNGHWYEFVGSRLDWDAARLASRSATHQGATGYLATVTSNEELMFLSGLRPDWSSYFLGGSDADHEGVWIWVDGIEAGDIFYTAADGCVAWCNWSPGEPNESGGGEDYLQGWFSSGGRWNDLGSRATLGYVVEYSAPAPAPVPLPAAGALLVGGLCSLAAVRSRRRSA